MAAHPHLRAADPHDRNFLAPGQQSRKHHESGADDSKRKSDRAAAARTCRRTHGVRDINGRRNPQNDERGRQPFPVCAVYVHVCEIIGPRVSFLRLLRDAGRLPQQLSQKTSAGPRDGPHRAGTRIRNSAPRGRCTNRTTWPSGFTIATFRPGCPGTSSITLNGCRLILPYGQFSRTARSRCTNPR